MSNPNLCSLLFFLVLLAIYWRPFSDTDLLWQMRTGEEIVRTGQLRLADTFTYTIEGKHLPDFEGLYEVLLWAVWSAGGLGGLHLLKTLCVLTPLFLLGWRLRREGVSSGAVLAAVTLAALVLIPTWNLRPFYCTTIGLLLLSGWLHDHCNGRRPISWETPLLMLVWANTHPGVITGQGLLAGAISWEWLNRWLRLNPPLDSRACWRLTLFGGPGLLASLICPGPLDRLRYTFNPDLAHPIMRGFVEMRPLYEFAFRPPFLFGLAYVVAVAVLVTLVYRFRSYRLWEVALLAGTALLANFALRSLQDWLVVMLALGVPQLARMRGQERRERSQSSPAPLDSATRLQPGWAILLLGLLSVFSLTPALSGLVPREHGKDWPVEAIDHVEREGLTGRFFCNPNHGAYLVWRLGPDRVRCYTDTRGFFFPPELLEDTVQVTHLGSEWKPRLRQVLERGTDYFLLETDGPAGALWRALDGQVTPLYRDEHLVLVRAADVRAWAERRGRANSG